MKFYVTFGQVHEHWINGIHYDKDSVAVIEAEDHGAAREKAFELFGPKFFTTYPEDRFKEDDLKYFPRGLINV